MHSRPFESGFLCGRLRSRMTSSLLDGLASAVFPEWQHAICCSPGSTFVTQAAIHNSRRVFMGFAPFERGIEITPTAGQVVESRRGANRGRRDRLRAFAWKGIETGSASLRHSNAPLMLRVVYRRAHFSRWAAFWSIRRSYHAIPLQTPMDHSQRVTRSPMCA